MVKYTRRILFGSKQSIIIHTKKIDTLIYRPYLAHFALISSKKLEQVLTCETCQKLSTGRKTGRQTHTTLQGLKLHTTSKMNFGRKVMFVPTLDRYVRAYEECGQRKGFPISIKFSPHTKIYVYDYRYSTLTGDLFSKLFGDIFVKTFVITSRFDKVVSFLLLPRVHFN